MDRRDAWCERATTWWVDTAEDVLVPQPVVVETAALVGRRQGAAAEARFLRWLLAGEVVVESLGSDDLVRAADLVDAYADFPLGFVDASIVAIAERLEIRDLLTTDRRHFGVIRPAHCERLRLLP
jgi:hypothetical protein